MMNTTNTTQESQKTVVEAIRPDGQVTTIIAPNGCVVNSTTGSIFAAMKAAAKDWDWD